MSPIINSVLFSLSPCLYLQISQEQITSLLPWQYPRHIHLENPIQHKEKYCIQYLKLNTGKAQTYWTCPKLPAVHDVKIFDVLILLFLIKASIDGKFLLHFVLIADVLQCQCSWGHIDKSPVNPESLQFHQRRLMGGVPQRQNSASSIFNRDSC